MRGICPDVRDRDKERDTQGLTKSTKPHGHMQRHARRHTGRDTQERETERHTKSIEPHGDV